MNIPKYWGHAVAEARKPDGSVIPVIKWHWSEQSVADAEEKARERLQAVVARVAAGQPFPEHYAYCGDQPLREEVVREIAGAESPQAVITRNAYGALILNVDKMMFIDIDLPELNEGHRSDGIQLVTVVIGKLKGWAAKLFGSGVETVNPMPSPPPPQKTSAHDGVLENIERWVARNPGWAFRAYRTYSGLRLIAINDLFDATDNGNLRNMQALGCDPLYIKLCRSQKRFRARLTPKPRRIGWHVPNVRFPYLSERQQRAIGKWIAEYEKRATNYASCKYLKTIGSSQPDARLAPLIDLHDEMTKANSDLPLA